MAENCASLSNSERVDAAVKLVDEKPSLTIPSAVLVGPVLACQDFMVLALPTPNFWLIASNRPNFNMMPCKSYRVRKAHTI
jgi:hypothetical protein